MMVLGFSNTELKAIYAVLAAIIHLSHTKIVKKGEECSKSKMNCFTFVTFALYVFIQIVYLKIKYSGLGAILMQQNELQNVLAPEILMICLV